MQFKSIDTQQSLELIENGALIIDVREKDEFDNFHIKNAFLIPLSQISSSKVLEINPDKKKNYNSLQVRGSLKTSCKYFS